MFRFMPPHGQRRTPASELSLVPPPERKRSSPDAGPSAVMGSGPRPSERAAAGDLRARVLSSSAVTTGGPATGPAGRPLGQRPVAMPALLPAELPADLPAGVEAPPDPQPLATPVQEARQAYWQGVETVIDLLADGGADDVAVAALRDVVRRRVEAEGARDDVPDLWEPLFHALAQPAARQRDMRDRLTQLARLLFGAVRVVVPSPLQARACLAPFAGHLREASAAVREDAWEGVRLALVDRCIPSASYPWVLASGLSAGIPLARGRDLLTGIFLGNDRADGASRQALVRQVPDLLAAWVAHIAAMPQSMDHAREDGILGVRHCIAAVAADDEVAAEGREAAFGRLLQAVAVPAQAARAALSAAHLAILCRDVGQALGGTRMGEGARRDLVAFLVQAGGAGLGPAYLRLVESLVTGALSPHEVQRDAFGQRVTEIDTGWAARRSLLVDTLRALGATDEARLPREALAHALAGLGAALQDQVLLHASQRAALLALLESELLRWPPARALVAGIGWGPAADLPEGKGKGKSGRMAPAGPATAREQLDLGRRLRQDLCGVFDAPGLDDDTRVFALVMGLRLAPLVLAASARDEVSRLLEHLQGSALSPALKARLALVLVREIRVPPTDRQLRAARDIILGRLGGTALSAEAPPSWAAWQARHLAAAQDLRAGGHADRKGDLPDEPAGDEVGQETGLSSVHAGPPVRGPWLAQERVEAIAQADAYYDAVETWLRRLRPAATLWRPVPPLRYLEVEIEHLMRMDGIPEAVRQPLVERLSVWGTEWAQRAASGQGASSQTTQGSQAMQTKHSTQEGSEGGEGE